MTFPTDVRGFSVSKKLDKVGNLSSDTAVLYFEDCRIPARYLLGDENGGFAHIMINFQGERLVAALIAVSGMELMLQDAIDYARERQAFGRPLIGFQVWRHRFAEHLASVEAAKRLTYHATTLFDAGLDPVKEISMAKLFAGDLAQRVAYDCQQIYGGNGLRRRDGGRPGVARRAPDHDRRRDQRDHEGDHRQARGAVSSARRSARLQTSLVLHESAATSVSA